MKQGMEESYEKGVANHSAPSFALGTSRGVRRSVNRGTGGLGIELRKDAIRTPTLLHLAEGNTSGGDIASPLLGPA